MRSGILWSLGLRTTLTGGSLAQHKSTKNWPRHTLASLIVEVDGLVGRRLSRPLEVILQSQNVQTLFTV